MRENKISIISNIILDVVCVLIFAIAAQNILEDVYRWGDVGESTFIIIAIMTVVVSLIMETSYHMKEKIGSVVRFGVLIVGLLVFTMYFFIGDSSDKLVSGIQTIASYYVKDINAYYKMDLFIEAGKSRYIDDALGIIWIFTTFVNLWSGKTLRNNITLAFLPLTVLLMELAVGFSPVDIGLILMFIGVLVANSSGFKETDFKKVIYKKNSFILCIRSFSWMAVGVIAIALSVVVSNIASDKADEMLIYADDVKSFVNEKMGIVTQHFTVGGSNIVENLSVESITNEKPEYKEIEMLNVKTSVKPIGDIYLKGYYGSNYVSGTWYSEIETYESMCNNSDYDVDKMSWNIATIGVDKIISRYETDTLAESDYGPSLTITYANENGTRAYLPYFVEVDKSEIGVVGDSRYVKSAGDKSVTFNMWYFESEYRERRNLFGNESLGKWEKWYENAVLTMYLDVPDNMVEIKKLASQLMTEIENDEVDNGIRSENEVRLIKAEYIIGWMQENTSYSHNLATSTEQDAIEYFIGRSKRGYCTHYASASVLLLREMGVPARYVTGYRVSDEDFVEDDGVYTVSVLDSDGHAWVEVFLNGVGWVPIEVTNGYSTYTYDKEVEEMPTKELEVEIETETTTKREENTTNNESTTTSRNETQTTTKTQETTKEQETVEEETTSDPDKIIVSGDEKMEQYGEKNSLSNIKILKWLLWIVVVFIGIICVYVLSKYIDHLRVKKLVEKKQTLKAIQKMNRSVYRKVRMKSPVLKKYLTDVEYEECLKKSYQQVISSDWEKYMEIVKSATFSTREFTVKEMEFCYYIYRIVKGES